MQAEERKKRVLLFANTAWYLYNFRLLLAKDLRKAGYEVMLASPRDEYVEKLEREGFIWHQIDISRRGRNPWHEVRALFHIIKTYRNVKPDLCHHFTIKPVLYGSIAARMLRVEAVVNAITGLGYLFMHSNFINRLARFVAIPLYRFALRHPNSIAIFQNSGDQHVYESLNLICSDRTVVIPGSGVDPDRFKPGNIVNGGKQIVLIARMLWDKGIQEYVEAIRLLKARGYNGKALLVGGLDDGNPSGIPVDIIKAWQDDGIVEWLGHREDILSIMQESTVVVLPSYREGLSRVLIEAAAAGRPIVASDVPGCKEVVQHGVNGYLVPVRNPKLLADSIARILCDPEMIERFGDAGRMLVLEKFSSRIINTRTIGVYRLLLEQTYMDSGVDSLIREGMDIIT